MRHRLVKDIFRVVGHDMFLQESDQFGFVVHFLVMGILCADVTNHRGLVRRADAEGSKARCQEKSFPTHREELVLISWPAFAAKKHTAARDRRDGRPCSPICVYEQNKAEALATRP